MAQRLPTVFAFRENVEDGGLISYGTNLRESLRRTASFVDKILKGAKPGDLPIEFPTKLVLLINLTTAKALELTIPPELRALRPLQGTGPYVFTTEAGTPVTTVWFLRMVQRTGRAAKLPFPIHPHMLRHATGFKLANDGHDTRSLAHYLGHRNLQSTARYTALAPDRFAKFWQD